MEEIQRNFSKRRALTGPVFKIEEKNNLGSPCKFGEAFASWQLDALQ